MSATLYARPVDDRTRAAFPEDDRPSAPADQVLVPVETDPWLTDEWEEVAAGVEARRADCGLGCRCAAEVRLV